MHYGKSSNAFNDEDEFSYGDDGYDSQEEESMDDVVQRQLLLKQQ